ncbi:vif protein [Simian immunodeficiency virus]|uniref:Virion infectivity factor n=1 Tax=Simian immunodeficiency virus TaxID=11723 RepID=K4MLI8_SIV|nr:vif protein [Simian immunodeficiency virus]
MQEEKRWVMVPTWRIPGRLERWHSLIKHLKYNTRELQKVCYVPHHKVGWAWWTCSRVIFPLQGETHLEIQGYWNLTPEKGWLSTYAVRITWYTRNFWTDVTPDYADVLLHGTYFTCFSEGEVRRAIRGEQLLSCCRFPKAHRHQVPSLQYLALRVVSYVRSQGKNPTWKQWRRDSRGSLRLARKNGRRNEQGGRKSSTKGTNFPGVAKVLGILA